MKLLRVSAAVINTTPLDWDGNRRRISGAIGAARAAGVSILCLPELCITGYGCEDAHPRRAGRPYRPRNATAIAVPV